MKTPTQKTPKEVLLEMENRRLERGLAKGKVCKSAGIVGANYSAIVRAGQRNMPFHLESLNKIRRVLGMPLIKRQIVLLET